MKKIIFSYLLLYSLYVSLSLVLYATLKFYAHILTNYRLEAVLLQHSLSTPSALITWIAREKIVKICSYGNHFLYRITTRYSFNSEGYDLLKCNRSDDLRAIHLLNPCI